MGHWSIRKQMTRYNLGKFLAPKAYPSRLTRLLSTKIFLFLVLQPVPLKNVSLCETFPCLHVPTHLDVLFRTVCQFPSSSPRTRSTWYCRWNAKFSISWSRGLTRVSSRAPGIGTHWAVIFVRCQYILISLYSGWHGSGSSISQSIHMMERLAYILYWTEFSWTMCRTLYFLLISICWPLILTYVLLYFLDFFLTSQLQWFRMTTRWYASASNRDSTVRRCIETPTSTKNVNHAGHLWSIISGWQFYWIWKPGRGIPNGMKIVLKDVIRWLKYLIPNEVNFARVAWLESLGGWSSDYFPFHAVARWER